MHRSDFESASGNGWTGPDSYVWVVAVTGDFGPRGEYSNGPNTSAIFVIQDDFGHQVNEIISYKSGDWPPLFDRLPDLSNGT